MDIRRPLLIIVLLSVVCCSVQATSLLISVIDESGDTPIAGASVSVNGEYAGRTDSQGRLTHEHAETESLDLKITKAGYEDWFDIVSASDTSLLAEMARTSVLLTVVLYDADTVAPVAGSLVKVSGEDFADSGRSDAYGRAEFEVLASGTYTVEIVTPRYATLVKTVAMGDGAKEVQYWLFRNDQFVVKVTDAETGEPVEGAAVAIDGDASGVTDDLGMLLLYLEREQSCTFRVEKLMYRTMQERRYLGADEAVYEVTLEKALYPVSFSVFGAGLVPVEGAKVYIDGALHATTDTYGRCATADLVAGSHTIEVRCDGYEDWQQTLELAVSGEDIVVNLAYATAEVVITVEDADHRILPGAMVYVDGTELGVTNANGQITAALITAAVYNLTASQDGYVTGGAEHGLPLGTREDAATITLHRALDPVLFAAAGIGIGGLLLVGYGVRRFPPKRRKAPGKKNRL